MFALSLTILISLMARAGAHGAEGQPPPPPTSLHKIQISCGPELESDNKKINAGQLIKRLLNARGEAVGATDIGLFEVHTQSGESILSEVHWSNDGSKPLTSTMMAAFAARLSRRIHQGTRINGWTLNMESGRLVIQSVPLDQLAPRMDDGP